MIEKKNSKKYFILISQRLLIPYKGVTMIKKFIAVLLASACCLACANQRVWTYNAGQKITRQPLINKSVAVPDFSDSRINDNSNHIAFGLIPLIPFGWLNLQTPEGGQQHISSGLWLFRPPEDFAKATASELENSGLFKEVFYTSRKSDADLTLQGAIKSTQYTGKIFFYGLSIPGDLLWFIGFPQGYSDNALEIHLTLVDNHTGATLWENSYSGYIDQFAFLYYVPADFRYDDLMKKALGSAVSDMQKQITATKLQQ